MLTSTILKRLVGVIASLALALGFTSLATAPATAASTVWDRVARCESGGNRKINTGNGYYGGLQFDYGTWLAHGGGAFAQTADLATPAQQALVASRLTYDGWPSCPNP